MQLGVWCLSRGLSLGVLCGSHWERGWVWASIIARPLILCIEEDLVNARLNCLGVRSWNNESTFFLYYVLSDLEWSNVHEHTVALHFHCGRSCANARLGGLERWSRQRDNQGAVERLFLLRICEMETNNMFHLGDLKNNVCFWQGKLILCLDKLQDPSQRCSAMPRFFSASGHRMRVQI